MAMPRTPAMYAPQLFHGMSGDVTVPESSTARDSMRGAMPRLRELGPIDAAGHDDRDVLIAGHDVEADARRDDRGDEASGRLGGCDDGPDKSLEEAGLFHDRREAQRAQDQPDRVQHRRHAATREQGVDGRVAGDGHETVRHRHVERLDSDGQRSRSRLADERGHELGLGEPRQHTGKDGAAEDRQERRNLADREDVPAPATAAG